MPNTVTGQSFDVVTCQSCETDLAFQKAKPSRRAAQSADKLEITCGACGHMGSYLLNHIRQNQAEYPL
jgi:RNase P subunit RPR2